MTPPCPSLCFGYTQADPGSYSPYKRDISRDADGEALHNFGGGIFHTLRIFTASFFFSAYRHIPKGMRLALPQLLAAEGMPSATLGDSPSAEIPSRVSSREQRALKCLDPY